MCRGLPSYRGMTKRRIIWKRITTEIATLFNALSVGLNLIIEKSKDWYTSTVIRMAVNRVC